MNAIALVVITILIVWEAIERFYTPRPVAGGMMMMIAVAGLLANVLAFWVLHRGAGEEPQCSRRGLARNGRFTGVSWRDHRGVDHHLDRLDASGSDPVDSGFRAGTA